MLEHMSRQMDTLRQILRIQEDKMGKAGILVESHADILDRMFWAEVPEAGKKSVLLSSEAPCVPPRNMRQFVEVLLERGDKRLPPPSCRITATVSMSRMSSRAQDRHRPKPTGRPVCRAWTRLDGACRHAGSARHLCKEPDPELQSLLSAAFVRIGSEASTRRMYNAVSEVC